MRKRSFGQRWEVVEADVSEDLDEYGWWKVGIGIVHPWWKLYPDFLGMRDQTRYSRPSQGADGSAQDLGV